jgi:Putative Ig domain
MADKDPSPNWPFGSGLYVSTLFGTHWPGVDPLFLTSAAVSGTPVWPSFAMANGTVGIAYSQSWDLAPALTPTTYSVVSGSLPPGLALNNITADQGSLTGTPTTVGTYTFTIRATNSLGTADKSFTITISAAAAGGAFTFWN